MTSYHSTKSDFPDTLYTYDVNVSKTITDKLDDIEAVTKVIKENGVSHLYVQTGDASLGKEMPESDFTSAESKTGKLLGYATRLHDEIMANIDSKFVRGMRTVFGNLSDNLNTDEFKTKNMTYMADGGTYRVPKPNGGYQDVAYQTPKSYTLTQILDHKASPISATKKVYDRQLKLAKEKAEMADQKANELQKKLESGSLTSESQIRDYQTQIKSYRSLGDLKNKEEELMTSLYGTGMGNQSAVQIKSSAWQEANKEWLEPIERYLGIGLVAVSLVATVATFGAASPVTSVTSAIGTGYALADSGYTAATGNSMISGTRQTVAEQKWAAAEFWTTAASLGASRYLKDTSRVYKAINYADDAVNVGHVAYNGIVEGEDPTLSLLSFAGGKVVGQLQASRSVAGESGVKVDSRVDISGKSVRLEGESNRASGLDVVDANKISVGTAAATITAGRGANIPTPEIKPETTRQIINQKLQEYDITWDRFNELRNTHVSKMTQSDYNMMIDIRDSIPNPTVDTIMQKILPINGTDWQTGEDFDTAARMFESDEATVGGYVAKRSDVKNITNINEAVVGLRLDYEGSPFVETTVDSNGNRVALRDADGNLVLKTDSYLRLEYVTEDTGYITIPYGNLDGNAIDSSGNVIVNQSTGTPYTIQEPASGNGFIKSDSDKYLVPEYRLSNNAKIQPGSKLYLNIGGEEVLVGRVNRDGVMEYVEGIQ